jgi:TetR/AcrR family transcriptional regulator, transcriptional repressor for nem operon
MPHLERNLMFLNEFRRRSFIVDRESCDFDARLRKRFGRGGVGGCPLGSLANELAAHSEEARHQLDQSFAAWGMVIEKGRCRMRERGQIKSSANPKAMSVAVLAAIQGGILLSKTARDSQPLELALDMALSHLGRFAE